MPLLSAGASAGDRHFYPRLLLIHRRKWSLNPQPPPATRYPLPLPASNTCLHYTRLPPYSLLPEWTKIRAICAVRAAGRHFLGLWNETSSERLRESSDHVRLPGSLASFIDIDIVCVSCSDHTRPQGAFDCLILRSTRGGSEAQSFHGDITVQPKTATLTAFTYTVHLTLQHCATPAPSPLSRVRVFPPSL